MAKSYGKNDAAHYPSANVVPSATRDSDVVYALANAIKAGGGTLVFRLDHQGSGEGELTGACGQYKANKHPNMIHSVQVMADGDQTKVLGLYDNLSSTGS